MRSFLTILFLVFIHSLFAQCPSGDLELTTQAEVDAFVVMYPDCTELPGDLKLDGDDINSLSAFQAIKKINGDLQILNSSSLEHLFGFEQLEIIEGNLGIAECPNLNHLVGLSGLKSIGGSFYIYFNSFLKFIGLDNIETIGGSFSVIETNLFELGNLKNVNQLFGISLFQCNVDNLSFFDGISQLHSLSITACPYMTSLNGLENLTALNGTITLSANKELINISALAHLEYSNITTIKITQNEKLSNCAIQVVCDFLNDENSLANATIQNNGSNCSDKPEVISYCTGEFPECPEGSVELLTQSAVNAFVANYPNCTEIQGDLLIGREDIITSAPITDISGMAGLEKIYGNLEILGGQFYDKMDIGLNNIHWVGGDLIIEGIYVKNDATILNKLDQVDGSVSIRYINNDESLNPIPNIVHIGNTLTIANCLNLKGLSGFDKLISLNSLNLSYNSSFEEIMPLPALNTLAGISITDCFSLSSLHALASISNLNNSYLILDDNPSLSSLDGLENIADTSINFLRIRECPELTFCGLSNICAYLKNGGEADIYLNADNCNGETQIIQTSCLVDADGDGFLDDVDCNDSDPSINPDAIDIPNNGIDEDCDGSDLINSVIDADLVAIKVLPNPADDFMVIENIGKLKGHLAWYSINGQLLFQQELLPLQMLDLKAYPSGVYILNIEMEKRIWTERVAIR